MVFRKDECITNEEVEMCFAAIEQAYEERDMNTFERLTLSIDPNDSDFIEVEVVRKTIPFNRIRRITGYLVGDVSKFNDSKQREESDRVKHNI